MTAKNFNSNTSIKFTNAIDFYETIDDYRLCASQPEKCDNRTIDCNSDTNLCTLKASMKCVIDRNTIIFKCDDGGPLMYSI